MSTRPTLRERRHRGLARRLVAVRRRGFRDSRRRRLPRPRPQRRVELGGDTLEPPAALLGRDRGGTDTEANELCIGEREHGAEAAWPRRREEGYGAIVLLRILFRRA
jgi:hypothetical protein